MKNMRLNSLIAGVVCVAVGIYSFTQGTPNETTGVVSKTALIPAWIGLVFLIAAALSHLKPLLHKHAMHLAAIASLIGLLGAAMPIKVRGFDFSQASVQGSVLLFLTCGAFLVLAIRSFIAARVKR